MKLFDFGTSALVLVFLGGFFLSLGADKFGESVAPSYGDMPGVTFSESN